MNNISKVFSVIFSVCMMSGCVYRGFLPENYKFDSQNKKGLVVFSISCDIVQADINFILTNKYGMPDHYIPVSCGDLSDGQLRMLPLPPGRYHFNGFQADLGLEELASPGFNNIYFDVKPGVINYLGWIQLKNEYANHLDVDVINAKSRDIPWLKKVEPNINAPVVVQKLSENP